MGETKKSAATKNKTYDDILHKSRPLSTHRIPMPISARAAQFAPFAALTGHAATLGETARLTDNRIELSEERKEELNAQLTQVIRHLAQRPQITLCYFVPDPKKEGGTYVTRIARAHKWNEALFLLTLEDGSEIPIEDIIELEEI